MTIVHSIFSVMAGLIVEMLFMLSSVLTLRIRLTISEYEVYWLTDFPLIILLGTLQEIIIVISHKKQTNKYKKKIVILQSIGIIVIKSKETRAITYTYRYFSGHFIPIIQFCQGLNAH